MNRFLIYSLAFVFSSISLIKSAKAYCFYNQTGSEVPVIQVYVYKNKSDAEFGIGLKLGSDIIGGDLGGVLGKTLVFLKPIGAGYGLINQAIKKAKHVIRQGEKQCWNWKDIKKDTGQESMFFIVIDDDAAKRNKLEPLWGNELSTHDGLVFCKKDGVSLVSRNQLDSRCGDKL